MPIASAQVVGAKASLEVVSTLLAEEDVVAFIALVESESSRAKTVSIPSLPSMKSSPGPPYMRDL